MFCTECGQQMAAESKFCQNCGSPVAGGSTSAGSLVDRALGSDSAVAEEAKRQIIDAVDVESMRSCARRALIAGDTPAADFWYVEWVTAPDITVPQASEAIAEYVEKILMPQRRFSEAELYLSWVAAVGPTGEKKKAGVTLQQVHQSRGATGLKRYRSKDEWRSVDVSLPLDPNWSEEMQYRRTIAWVDARSSDGSIEALAQMDHPQHLSYVAGFLIGVRDAAERLGSNFEAQVQGLIDWINLQTSLEQAAANRSVPAKAPTPKSATPTNTKPQASPAPTTNELGLHVDRLFSDAKMAAAVKTALGVTGGTNDDFVVAAIPVTAKLGDYEDSNNYMVFTRDRAAIVKKGGMFSTSESQGFRAIDIDHVGVGDSDHYEGQGFGGRTTNWLSLTIQLHSGQSFTRHYYLGRNENEVNSNIPFIREAFDRMGRVGYILDSGPAWTSSGGYHTSYGFGFGVWR